MLPARQHPSQGSSGKTPGWSEQSAAFSPPRARFWPDGVQGYSMFVRHRAGLIGRTAFTRFLALILLLLARPAFAQPDAAAEPGAACDASNLLRGKAPVDQQNVTGELPRITDGTIDAEGAEWDAPTAVTIMGSGSVTFDLGSVRQVGAVLIQADANDIYVVTGSLDGTPGSFKSITELRNVREAGHGLRERTAVFAPVSV